MENNRMTNRLANEKSPYLLQHAQNPVDWYPWNEEAFAEAQKRDVPVFLSIGYSTCHWCHVMEHESFEDHEVAELLNQNYVSIKVDREERPDIDSVYMTVCQALTGAGGWPLTVIMTPEKKPFFAGTYFPKKGQYGGTGLMDLLAFITEKWNKDRQRLLKESEKITEFVKRRAEEDEKHQIQPKNLIEEANQYFADSFDKNWGGFGPMPKFPSPHNLLFLLEQKEMDFVSMAEKTLVQMYRGGLFDHIGGGFSRYSTDDRWLVPHFEKMLYDNALLVLAYAEAYRVTGKELYKAVADQTVNYVLRELTDEGGGFYCSQDADSDGEEGKYYVFAPGEIKKILGEEEGEAFCKRFDITMQGNFEGKSIPNLLKDPHFEKMPEEGTLEKLYQYRLKRTRLHKDDKVLTGWNGLMIAALARAGRIFGEDVYLNAAERAAEFVWEHLQYEDGRLLVRWRHGDAAYPGALEDYAFFTWALLECYSSTFDIAYLKRAVLTGNKLLELFFDEENGGCFLYGKDSEQLFVRPKEVYDGAMPSGNSAAALIMRKLSFFTGEQQWRSAWQKQQAFLVRRAHHHPAGHSFFLWQLCEEGKEQGQLICVSSEKLSIEALRQLPLEILVKTEENRSRVEEIVPFMKDYPMPAQGTDYYFCRHHQCSQPVHSMEEIEKIINNN